MKTRDGREIQIFFRDGGGRYPIMGAVAAPNPIIGWYSERWSPDGRACSMNDSDASIHPSCLPEFQAEAAKR